MGTRVEHVAGYESPSRVVLDSEVSEIRLLLQEYAGVLIDRPSEVLAEIIADFLASHRLTSASELIGAMRARPEEGEALLELLLPGDTAFFRKPEIFQAFQKQLLASMQPKKNGDTLRPLRIWSAGCSTGEEAYSIGISICEAFQRDNSGWNAHIVAGDIRRNALKTAERGLYPASLLAQVPRSLVAAYFARMGEHFLVKPRLRNLVTFTRMNLIEPAFMGRFDCIFCLDVLPHLSTAGKTALWQRLQLSLEPGGYIFLAEKEQLPPGATFIQHSAPGCSYYQRPLAAVARSGM
ncbi:MAG TPA: CheR family methyltransferase [Terriglobales bacterium]